MLEQQVPIRLSAVDELEFVLESTDYLSVTELSGTEATEEQVDRISHRYGWAVNRSRSLTIAEPLLIVMLPSKIAIGRTMIARDILNPR